MVTLSGLLTQVPLMLLGKFRGPEEAGFYRLALDPGKYECPSAERCKAGGISSPFRTMEGGRARGGSIVF